MQYNLKSKKIFITGATGGIGIALCKKFIQKDCILICTSTSSEKIEKIKHEFGDKHFYYKLNFSNTEAIEENCKSIVSEHKNIDVLINNAGLTKDSLLMRMSRDNWNEVMNVNLNSNYYLIKEVLPIMVKNKQGTIIGISSVVALTGNPGQANYTASKNAMIAMYKSLAQEVGQRNIRINVIAPGFIESPMTQKLSDDQIDLILKKIPLKKLGTPKDVANIAAFLCSDEASYITGQTFHVNGGMLMV